MPELSEQFQAINREWVSECETALKACPAEFTQRFIAIMFLGQSLITETRIVAAIDGAKEEVLRRFGLVPDPPDVDDSVKCCPECEKPNQFGELCQSCIDDISREEHPLDRAEREHNEDQDAGLDGMPNYGS